LPKIREINLAIQVLCYSITPTFFNLWILNQAAAKAKPIGKFMEESIEVELRKIEIISLRGCKNY